MSFRSKFPVRFFVVSLVALLLFATGLTAQAAGGEWSDATSGVLSVYNSLGKFLRGIILVGALVVLGEIIVKLMSGDKEAAHKLLWWLLGLSIGFGLISFLIN